MYIYTHIYTKHTCTMHVYVYIYVYICIYICIYIYIYIYLYIYIHIYIYVCMYVCKYTHVHVYVYVCKYIYIYRAQRLHFFQHHGHQPDATTSQVRARDLFFKRGAELLRLRCWDLKSWEFLVFIFFKKHIHVKNTSWWLIPLSKWVSSPQ